MRKNVLVKFIREEQGVYDPSTGTYIDDKETTIERYCNVTQLTRERSFKEFGEYLSNALSIRSTEKLNFSFNYVEINGKRFKLLSRIDSLGRLSAVVQLKK